MPGKEGRSLPTWRKRQALEAQTEARKEPVRRVGKGQLGCTQAAPLIGKESASRAWGLSEDEMSSFNVHMFPEDLGLHGSLVPHSVQLYLIFMITPLSSKSGPQYDCWRP